MFKKVWQFFCHHDYEVVYITNAFVVVDGWIERPKQLCCKKCGKTVSGVK